MSRISHLKQELYAVFEDKDEVWVSPAFVHPSGNLHISVLAKQVVIRQKMHEPVQVHRAHMVLILFLQLQFNLSLRGNTLSRSSNVHGTHLAVVWAPETLPVV